MAKVKVQISIEEDLLRQVEDYCDRNYTNRSMLISQSLVQVLNQQKMIDSLANVSIAVRTCAEKGGKMDEETVREIETFETLCKIFMGK